MRHTLTSSFVSQVDLGTPYSRVSLEHCSSLAGAVYPSVWQRRRSSSSVPHKAPQISEQSSSCGAYTTAVCILDPSSLRHRQLTCGLIGALNPLLPLFTSLLHQSYGLPIKLTIQVFCTRADIRGDDKKQLLLDELPRGLSLASGRAWLPQVLSEFVDRTTVTLSQETNGVGRICGNGVIVGVCGPSSLADDAREAIALLGKEREDIGGVELHEE